MPFTRSARNDRRRRVMREAVAADAGLAVESVRARQRKRSRADDGLDSQNASSPKRDPGYSQAVRRACQQRLVQLIPVRRSSLLLTVAGFWTLWLVLMLGHYWVHIRPSASKGMLPVALLFHLRSTHGIAYWLAGQFWTLTALASLMIFQLRKHKLDDYRAKYRVWGVLAAAALFSSFDASSSALYLIGTSIDGWTQREVGYSGWAVVLATFSTLVGMLGLRLCSEIKSAPLSLFFWLTGLAAWAFSALLGTKLMHSPWSSTMTDMLVGGAWLGGILSVFLAAAIYLRHIYIEAQRRFMLRNRMLHPTRKWKMPRFSLRQRSQPGELTVEDDSDRDPDSIESHEDRIDKKQPRTAKQSDDPEVPNQRRWLRFPRWKSDPRLGEDYSDIAAEQRKRDDGFEEPLGKKGGWFSKKQTSSGDSSSREATSNAARKSVSHTMDDDQTADNASPDFREEKPSRKAWWRREPKPKSPTSKPNPTERSVRSANADSAKPKRRWFQKTSSSQTSHSKSPLKTEVKARTWGLFKKRPPVEGTANTSRSTADASDRPRRRLFGFLDRLKLKPPTEGKSKSAPIPVQSNRTSIPANTPSQRTEASKQPHPYSESRQPQNTEDEDYDDDSTRNLSKAERKRLRRQQQENRRAA